MSGEGGTSRPRPRGKLAAILGLVLAIVVVTATCVVFRAEISDVCLRIYWRLQGVPGKVGITVVERPGLGLLVTTVLRRPNAVLQKSDIIVNVAGEDVKTMDDMARLVRGRSAGEVLSFVVRRGSETLELEVMLEPPPSRR